MAKDSNKNKPQKTQGLKLANKNFKVTIIRINTLKNLEEKVDQAGEPEVGFHQRNETLKEPHGISRAEKTLQIQRMY